MCRRNGSEMRLFPRKAVILIPSCAVPKKSFWVLLWRLTKVPQAERTDKNHYNDLPTKDRHKSKIRTGGARSRPNTLAKCSRVKKSRRFAEYLYINKHTFAAKKYLLSIISYPLSIIWSPRLCKWFLSVRSAGVLLSIVTKRSIESPDYMRPFTPYFHCDCVKNARNGATIAVLFSLPQQKYNAKFSHKSKLPTLTQQDLFFIRRKRESKWRLCGGKAAFRFHCAYS